jgi:hypothetical protein
VSYSGMLDRIQENEFICKNYLDSEAVAAPKELESCNDLRFFRINGLSDFWVGENEHNFADIMSDVINGISKVGNTFAYMLVSDGMHIKVILGVNNNYVNILRTSLEGSYPYIEIEPLSGLDLKFDLEEVSESGGIITGYPTNKTKDEKSCLQIEKLCKGLFGEKWVYFIMAKSLSPIQVSLAHNKLMAELNEIGKNIKRTISAGGTLGNQTMEYTNYPMQNYFDNLKLVEERLLLGHSRNMWRVCSYFASADANVADKMRNLIKAVFSGKDSKPEAIRCIPASNIRKMINSMAMVSDELPYEIGLKHPIGIWQENAKEIDFAKYRYQTMVTSDELGTFCQIPRIEMPGYYIDSFVSFEVAERRQNGNLVIGNIVNGNKVIDNKYMMDIEDLTRHGLIIGITGGGKTNTSKNLLRELWVNNKRPFMVIESAKREYWELHNMDGFDDLILFTLGSEEKNYSIPYRINPFEVVKGMSLQTHVDYLLSTFKASFELFPPMPYILETCVYEVYKDRGWEVLSNTNCYGREDFPTLTDLYYKVDVVTDRLGYHAEIQSNVKAALKARINSLRIGGKGAMMDTPISIPIETLVSRPVVMELEDIGDDDVKAFIMGILLVQLYEYRKTQLKGSAKLKHLLLIEEAHRLLSNVESGGEGANPRAKAVEFFCNLLAEIRSYGQGILIADQVPTKLAADTLKNTNLKITHRTVMQDDREIIGRSMNMTDKQVDYLSSLKRGTAAVYAEGDNRPKLVRIPLIKYKSHELNRKEVLEKVLKYMQNVFVMKRNASSIGAGCSFCQAEACHYSNIVQEHEKLGITKQMLMYWIEKLNVSSWSNLPGCIDYIEKNVMIKLLSLNQRLCLINLLLMHSKIEEAYSREIVIQYLKFYYSNGGNRNE